MPSLRCALLLPVLAPPVLGSAQERPAVNLVTHSRILIDRRPAAIWPLIVEPSGWKQGLALVHRSGPPGEEGQVLAAIDPGNPERVVFLVENVEVVPGERRTIKLYEPGGALLGFALWTLDPEGDRTRVGYDVYSESRLPPGADGRVDPAALAALAREARETNQRRFDAELMALKRLVESRP